MCGGWGVGRALTMSVDSYTVSLVPSLSEGADNVGGQLHSLISTEPFRGR